MKLFARTPGSTDRKPTPVRPRRPPMRGWAGRGRGRSGYVQQAEEWRGTSVQVCGLWPFAVGAGTPMVGVPFGRHLHTKASVCADPISWYQRANLISNPSAFFIGLPGLGKTAGVIRMLVGLSGYGVIPLVLGDTRPDYVEVVKRLGGQVIPLGPHRGALNVLDPGEAPDAAARLRAAGLGQKADEVLADAQGLRLNMMCSLIAVLRKSPPTAREEAILARAIRWLDQHHEGVPTMPDLLKVIQSAPAELREVALDRGVRKRYEKITEELEASLVALCAGGPFGDIFSRPTTVRMRRDRAVVYDVSAIPRDQQDIRAVALLASWSAGFSVVNIAQTLADAGLEPRRHYLVVLDELHQALRAGPGLVDRVDYLTRLNRTEGVGLVMVTHTLKDLLSLPSEEDRQKALGFIERSGMVVCAGLTMSEMPQLASVVTLSAKEQRLLAGWTSPATLNARTGRSNPPPGRGKFLIKVGGRPGIPVDLTLTEAEMSLHTSGRRWEQRSRTGLLEEAAP